MLLDWPMASVKRCPMLRVSKDELEVKKELITPCFAESFTPMQNNLHVDFRTEPKASSIPVYSSAHTRNQGIPFYLFATAIDPIVSHKAANSQSLSIAWPNSL